MPSLASLTWSEVDEVDTNNSFTSSVMVTNLRWLTLCRWSNIGIANNNDLNRFILLLTSTTTDDVTDATFTLPSSLFVSMIRGTLVAIGFANTYTLSLSALTRRIECRMHSYSTLRCSSFLINTYIDGIWVWMYLPRGFGMLYLLSRYMISTRLV